MSNKLKIDVITNQSRREHDNQYVKTLMVILNPEANGGESVILKVDCFDNGDETDNIYTQTCLSIQSYGSGEASVGFSAPLSSLHKACELILREMNQK